MGAGDISAASVGAHVPQCVVVMGVSGVGKSTVGEGLARHLGWSFIEGDALHPQANIETMRAGRALTDEQRAPWLAAIRDLLAARLRARESTVVTCSALKRAYRNVLRSAGPGVRFLHLDADESLVADRLAHRHGHFMPISLRHSQFETLEPLTADELDQGSVVVPVDGTPSHVIACALAALNL
jgi:carbohydrate kinase (thermoresistant glucokinase family)